MPLPDFLILGAAKAGTTALFGALSRHPQVFGSPEKEPRFLAYVGERPRFQGPGGEQNAARICYREEAYRALFAHCPPGAVAGEASTEYLTNLRAPLAARHFVPQARLIVILRHPVERAYSQYLHLRHEGFEPLDTFEAAWEAEPERIALRWRPTTQYRSRGLYGQALTRWINAFPREQLLVLFYEDWLDRPSHVLSLVCQHLNIEPLTNAVIRRENVSSRRPRWAWLHHRMVEDNRLRRIAQRVLPLAVRDAITRGITGVNLGEGPRLDATVRARLAAAYHDDLSVVEALTGRDLERWRT